MVRTHHKFFFFFFNDTATTEIYTLSLHDALPISIFLRPHDLRDQGKFIKSELSATKKRGAPRSEEHTSELQSPCNLVCRLLLEKKKKHADIYILAVINYELISIEPPCHS